MVGRSLTAELNGCDQTKRSRLQHPRDQTYCCYKVPAAAAAASCSCHSWTLDVALPLSPQEGEENIFSGLSLFLSISLSLSLCRTLIEKFHYKTFWTRLEDCIEVFFSLLPLTVCLCRDSAGTHADGTRQSTQNIFRKFPLSCLSHVPSFSFIWWYFALSSLAELSRA